jgi:hypothetical protein
MLPTPSCFGTKTLKGGAGRDANYILATLPAMKSKAYQSGAFNGQNEFEPGKLSACNPPDPQCF